MTPPHKYVIYGSVKFYGVGSSSTSSLKIHFYIHRLSLCKNIPKAPKSPRTTFLRYYLIKFVFKNGSRKLDINVPEVKTRLQDLFQSPIYEKFINNR